MLLISRQQVTSLVSHQPAMASCQETGSRREMSAYHCHSHLEKDATINAGAASSSETSAGSFRRPPTGSTADAAAVDQRTAETSTRMKKTISSNRNRKCKAMMAEEQLTATFAFTGPLPVCASHGHLVLTAAIDASGNAVPSLGSGKMSQLCQLDRAASPSSSVDSFLVILWQGKQSVLIQLRIAVLHYRKSYSNI